MLILVFVSYSQFHCSYGCSLQCREYDKMQDMIGNDATTKLHSEGKLNKAMQNDGTGKSVSERAEKTAIAAVADVLAAVTECLDDAKAEEVITIDIQDKTSIADYMVIASGRSHRHVSAVADQLLRMLKEKKAGAKVEGLESADWVLIDVGDVIVHLFRPEVREFYALEKMWQMPASDEKH